MAKRKAKKTAVDSRASVLQTALKTLRQEYGYSTTAECKIGGESCGLSSLDSRPVVVVFVPEQLDAVRPADEELATQLGAVVDDGPADYAWATVTGKKDDGFIYCWRPEQECPVSAIPAADALPAAAKQDARHVSADPVRFKELQTEFDSLHERIYAAREPIDGSNDLTAQLCKLIFLKMHLERNRDFRPVAGEPLFEEVFTAEYILAHKEKAVELIRKAFAVAKELPDYAATDDKGRDFRIFDPNDFIKFNQPRTYAAIAEMLNRHELTTPETTGVEDDVLGRAFDVMLRGRFEGKGGMGVYLTPQQVRDAMVQIVFHDILEEDSALLTRRDAASGEPVFRVCDPCCGSGGFLVTAMREVRKHVGKLVGLTDAQRAELLSELFALCFVGADNSPGMVLLARINMALHGDPKARVFRVENSLSADVFTPEQYDLILTNPPFKKGGVTVEENPEIMTSFQSGIDDGVPSMVGGALALGAKPDSKGRWKPVKRVDPAVLFIDRCLQLLKPGGRLLIVLPDGILCNAGDRYVREYIMGTKDEETGHFLGGKAVVKAVVSLPPVTFRLSGAGAKTSFLYIQKRRPGDEQGAVFMAVADDVGFDVKQNKEVLTGKNDLVSIVEAYKRGASDDGDTE